MGAGLAGAQGTKTSVWASRPFSDKVWRLPAYSGIDSAGRGGYCLHPSPHRMDAGVAKLADATDLKSVGAKAPYRFKPGPRHQINGFTGRRDGP
jgi:hypothetical protein